METSANSNFSYAAALLCLPRRALLAALAAATGGFHLPAVPSGSLHGKQPEGGAAEQADHRAGGGACQPPFE